MRLRVRTGGPENVGSVLLAPTPSPRLVILGALSTSSGPEDALMVFRVGATDAGLLANQLAADIPTPRDLVNLPNYRMFVKLIIEGRQSQPFSAVTLPPAVRLTTNSQWKTYH